MLMQWTRECKHYWIIMIVHGRIREPLSLVWRRGILYLDRYIILTVYYLDASEDQVRYSMYKL